MGIERAPDRISVTDDADTVVVIHGTKRHLDQLEAVFRRDLIGHEPTPEWMDNLTSRTTA